MRCTQSLREPLGVHAVEAVLAAVDEHNRHVPVVFGLQLRIGIDVDDTQLRIDGFRQVCEHTVDDCPCRIAQTAVLTREELNNDAHMSLPAPLPGHRSRVQRVRGAKEFRTGSFSTKPRRIASTGTCEVAYFLLRRW